MQRAARLRYRDFVFYSVQPGSARAPRSTMLMDPRRQRRSNGSFCDVVPWSGHLRKYAAYLVGNWPSLCLPVKQLISDLRYHRSILSHRWVNHDMSYLASMANGYFLLAELSIWNEFLSVINFKLRDVTPGQVALVCLRGRLVSVVSNVQRRHSFGLVHWLLMEYCCIKFVELCESNTFRNNFLFLDGFWLGCNLGHVKLCGYLLDDYLPIRNSSTRSAPRPPRSTRWRS
ncbi:hypothetical protein HPB49_009043 [Dermacentor silvarum]|uniref:Uncharacterized protein n=1 Tax=Dermacentor silvarum TaxID=543639 RepID=A0ACB8DYA5_DERSI|nr:hypothetical protein HPB49_009043 [Dermacentor silvarum]